MARGETRATFRLFSNRGRCVNPHSNGLEFKERATFQVGFSALSGLMMSVFARHGIIPALLPKRAPVYISFLYFKPEDAIPASYWIISHRCVQISAPSRLGAPLPFSLAPSAL